MGMQADEPPERTAQPTHAQLQTANPHRRFQVLLADVITSLP